MCGVPKRHYMNVLTWEGFTQRPAIDIDVHTHSLGHIKPHLLSLAYILFHFFFFFLYAWVHLFGRTGLRMLLCMRVCVHTVGECLCVLVHVCVWECVLCA